MLVSELVNTKASHISHSICEPYESIWCRFVQFGPYLMHAAKETSVDAVVAAVLA